MNDEKARRFLKELNDLSREHGVAISVSHGEGDKMPFLIDLEKEYTGYLYAMHKYGFYDIFGDYKYVLIPRINWAIPKPKEEKEEA